MLHYVFHDYYVFLILQRLLTELQRIILSVRRIQLL